MPQDLGPHTGTFTAGVAPAVGESPGSLQMPNAVTGLTDWPLRRYLVVADAGPVCNEGDGRSVSMAVLLPVRLSRQSGRICLGHLTAPIRRGAARWGRCRIASW